MEANSFLANLKANGSEQDIHDLDKVFDEYKAILTKLSTKDKASCALNVLCVLCRNLDKVPPWRDSIDVKQLLVLSIECVRGTRSMEKGDRVKTLACIYHIHKHAVKQTTPIPPELILKFSYMPFEGDSTSLLTEYHKTYWSILVDRLTYIERLKTKLGVARLLPKLIDDVLTVIKMYDSVSFVSNLLVFLAKKLISIFNVDLNEGFLKIFEALSKKSDAFKHLKDQGLIDIYMKFNECIVALTESSTAKSKGILDDIVQNCISILSHSPEIFHCFQTLYLNGFCWILNRTQPSSFVATIFNNMVIGCETTEKLGYKAVIYTYPYLSHLLRIYIENITRVDTIDFSDEMQIYCLKFLCFLMKKLRKCNQLLKCENCPIKTGLHDSLRLSFLIKNFINKSLSLKLDLIKLLPYYFAVVESQYTVLYELKGLGCSNYPKCFRKLQSDIHNTAIALNKAENFEFSIKFFDIYLKNEISDTKSTPDLNNICRGLYNKSICQLDGKLYEQALKDAFLSLVLANQDLSEKYMSLVMDIKAKMLKVVSETTDGEDSLCEKNQEEFQMMSVLDVVKMLLENNVYGDLRPFIQDLRFSSLLKHEFSMYVKLWPSIVPIAGVWRSLHDITREKHMDWLAVAETREDMLQVLYEIVLETPTVVRTIHSDYYKEIVMELVEDLEERSVKSLEEQIILATLLFLKAEYDLTDASERYAWKASDNTVDPDQGSAIRTLPQEHHALRSAVKAVELLTRVIKNVHESSNILHYALRIAEVFVQHFLHMQSYVHGLQLASICCELALIQDDKETYIRNAGVIISQAERQFKFVDNIIEISTKYVKELMKHNQSLETCLCFMCDLAIYYNRLELTGVAAKLVRYIQARILDAHDTQPDVNLDIAVGHLMEAQYELFGEHQDGQTILSVVNNIQRHYIAIPNSGTTFTSRRKRAIHLQRRSSHSGYLAVRAALSLRVYRRARAAAAVALGRSCAVMQAGLYANIINVASVEDAQVKIDNRLKHILGLQPTNESQPYSLAIQSNIKPETFTPKTTNFETMLDCVTFKKTQKSPSLPCVAIPTFKIPEFFKHTATCTCYACETVMCDILTCSTCGLEAGVFFRAKEFDVARSYYDGTLDLFEKVEARFKNKMTVFKSKNFDANILDIVGALHRKLLKESTIEFLIDAALFELSQECYDKSDDFVVRIHEIMSELRIVNAYIKNDVHNVMVASANLRKVKPELGLESDFEALKLTPDKELQIVKTPETKLVPKTATAMVVKTEELPNVKRKVIKLNLDENSDEVDVKPKRGSKKSQFKIPVPIIVKPSIETVTPRPSRSRPDITVTQPSLDVENTPVVNEFFTPLSTPSNELFFTPMSSIKTVKTYAKKSHIVKNLEAEFSTPKSVKKDTKNESSKKVDIKRLKNEGSKSKATIKGEGTEKVETKGTININGTDLDSKGIEKVDGKVLGTKKVETGSIKTLRDKRSLRRATSPGKLAKEDIERPEKVTRSRRKILEHKEM